MKLWGILVTIAMGFVFGLVFAGKGEISARLKAPLMYQDSEMNKIEEYWDKSDIEQSDLFKFVNDENCQSSEKYFLACVNSVLSGLKKTNQRLSLDGQILDLSEEYRALDNYREKEILAPYAVIYNEKLNRKFNFQKIISDMIEMNKHIPSKYFYALGINGFLSIYRDPHTYVLPMDYFNEVTSSSDRSAYFIGISLDKKDQKTIIRKVFKSSDAEGAGLRPLDRILTLNGRSVSNLNLSEISQILKDQNLKSFNFVIERQGLRYVKNLQRSYRILNQVQSEIIQGEKKTGLIQVSKFSKNTCEEVRADVLSLMEQKISGLVLDLRDNPGGQLSEAACLAGLFLGIDRKIYSVKYFDATKPIEVALTTSNKVYSGPLVVLTSNSSASAAELISGAFQEYHRAIIVGERTFGKGTFQEIETWSNKKNIGFFKTMGFYLLPSDASTQFYGVTPDIEMNDGDQLNSENLNYLNPVNPQVYNLKISAKPMFNFSDKNCLNTNVMKKIEDAFLDKALQVLSCQMESTGFAQLFDSTDFN
jgi:carboxyl-terminal processing protease